MKNIRLTLLICFLAVSSAFAQNSYTVQMDLRQVDKDMLKITILTPKIDESTTEYVMPSVIPGSYSKKDYGRFVERFKAFDKKGKKLKVSKIGENIFKIKKANKLAKIEYFVNDTWDSKDDNYIFQPGGTNIEKDKNIVVNHHGFYGYFEGYKMLPYTIEISKPANFYGGTPLKRVSSTATKDIFEAKDYVKLSDNPILYAEPDTVSFMAGNTRVHISSYSETGAVTAEEVKDMVLPLSKALADFFITMPVDEYHFLMYFPQNSPLNPVFQNGGYGALEHSYCSFYFLPEMSDKTRLRDVVVGVASHEFLHILTPLNIHSEEIEGFNFRDPEMSAHLWLYEGITEYFSNLVQIRSGLMDKVWFIDEMQTKIQTDFTFEATSFTEMSKRIIEPKFQDMYMNVYNKGALIGLLLDIRLNELSDGKMNLRQVMLDLSQKYGPSKPFKDDEIIAEITAMTYPEIGDFFKEYVEGDKPMPYAEYLDKIGLKYLPEANIENYFYGDFAFGYATNLGVFYLREASKNVFGLKADDILLKINGQELTTENANDLLEPLVKAEKDEEYSITIKRKGMPMTLKAKPETKISIQKHILREMEKSSEEQLKLRAIVLGKGSL